MANIALNKKGSKVCPFETISLNIQKLMLSIIVSSYDKNHLSMLEQSIEETIHMDYELIVIENNARYSLTEAYNLGASKSKFPYLLFIHEDVVFKTNNWGNILISYLNNLENVGVVGVAGIVYKPFVPSSWAVQLNRILSYNLIQGHKYKKQAINLTKINGDSIKNVICLDGVFLAVRKDVFEKIKFDETVKGFHGYDTDYSLSVAEKYQNYFIPNILIEHFSEGKINDQWIDNSLNIFDKWQHKLPFSADGKNEIDLEAELTAYADYLEVIFESTLPTKRKINIVSKITFHAVRKTRSVKFIRAFLYFLKNKNLTAKTNFSS